MVRIHKGLAYLYLVGILAIMGFVPFMLFVSEFVIIAALFNSNKFLCVLFIILLTFVMYGLGRNMLKMVRGKSSLYKSDYRFKTAAIAPIVILLLIAAASFGAMMYHGVFENIL